MDEGKRVLNGLVWRFLERSAAQGVAFIISIVLARLLEPKVYGTIAMVTVFTTLLQVFVDSGLGNSLIQKKDADDLDFCSVFYFNIALCLGLYLLMFVLAPYIASFYKLPELTSLVRVLSLTIIISGVKNIQQAYVSRHMLFKKFFFSTLGGTIGAAVVGIWMAYNGYGVWALVVQNIFNQCVDTAILWITVGWRPKKLFSWQRLRGLFSYGWKILTAAFIDTAYRDIRSLIIGRMYSSEDLAFYNKGQQFPKLIITNINSSIDSVLLPSLSNEQDDVVRLKAMTRKSIQISTFIIVPMMVGLAMCAEPLISIVLTDKWLPCVPYLQIFCFSFAFYPIHTANLNAIKALGRSDLYLKIEIIKKVIGLILVISTMWISVKAMAYSLIVSAIISQIINSWPNKRLLGYSYFEQMKDILPQISIAVLMGIIVYLVGMIDVSNVCKLVLQVCVGIFSYILLSHVFKIESYEYVCNLIRNRKR